MLFQNGVMLIRTFISPVSYRSKITAPALASIVINGRELCWLDSLLGGGIVIPQLISLFKRRPLIWLVSGPPGTGKTTFGLELCYRLSTTPQPEYQNQPLDVIYFSAESSKEVIEENIQRFGWSRPSEHFAIHGYEQTRNVSNASELFALLPKRQISGKIDDGMPAAHLIVIDSLNVIASQLIDRHSQGSTLSQHSESNRQSATQWSAANLIKSIDEQMVGQTWILMLMQDWEHDQGKDPAYAFIADIETRFYERPFGEYLLHYFRVVKMRFQGHARGNHVVKIYKKPEAPAPAARTVPASQATSLEICEGGVFILPSIHRHLSAVAPEPTSTLKPEVLSVPVQGLERIMPLGGGSSSPMFGFPKRRCTALVGSRGAMKSHLAYATLLSALESPKMCGIMLSLRDDIRAAEATLDEIARQQGLTANTAKYRDESRLDIVYFAPGYIPPEEFMHRVIVSIEGMIQRHGVEGDGRNIVAVLNGIDHLAARHPLCAAEAMFVPALVSYLRKSRVTSLVIAANDDPRPIDHSGLLPMADLLLQFKTCGNRPLQLEEDAQQVTEVIAQRVPAGATGGGEGYLYRRASANGRLEFRQFERRIDPMGAESIRLTP